MFLSLQRGDSPAKATRTGKRKQEKKKRMAKIADVLATERNRQQPQEWNKIHLFQMGDFYRAYEWSA